MNEQVPPAPTAPAAQAMAEDNISSRHQHLRDSIAFIYTTSDLSIESAKDVSRFALDRDDKLSGKAVVPADAYMARVDKILGLPVAPPAPAMSEAKPYFCTEDSGKLVWPDGAPAMSAETAIKWASHAMTVPMNKLPPCAVAYGRALAARVGGCAEVLIHAYACYAQAVLGLPAGDEQYAMDDHAKSWFGTDGEALRLRTLTAEQAAPSWRDCSQHPPDTEVVLVCCERWPDEVRLGRYIADLDEWRLEGSNSAWKMIEWMPVPKSSAASLAGRGEAGNG